MTHAITYIQAAVQTAASPFQKTQGLNRLCKLFTSTLDFVNHYCNTDAIPALNNIAFAASSFKSIYPLVIKPWDLAKTWLCSSPGKTLWQESNISRWKLIQTTLKTLKTTAKILQTPVVAALPYISAIVPALPAVSYALSLTNSTIGWCVFGERIYQQGPAPAILEEFSFWTESYAAIKKLMNGDNERDLSNLTKKHQSKLDSLKRDLEGLIKQDVKGKKTDDDLETLDLENNSSVQARMGNNQLFLMAVDEANQATQGREKLLQHAGPYLIRLRNSSTLCDRELQAYCQFLTNLETKNQTTRQAVLQYLEYRLNHRDTATNGLHQQLFDLIHKIEEEEYLLALLQSKEDRPLALSFCSQMEKRSRHELMSKKLAWIHTAKELAQIAAATIGLTTVCITTTSLTAPLLAASLAAQALGMAEFFYKENMELCQKKQPKLDLHEWGAVIVYIALLTSIALYTLVYVPYKYPEVPTNNPHWLIDPYFDVYITGAIEKPGVYRIRRGSTRGDLLTLANPHQNADLRRIKTSTKLREGELVEIPAKEIITIHVEGEVQQPSTITVEKGTKVSEIQRQIKLNPNADPTPLTRKRPLKDNEIIRIKKKKK